MNRFVAMMLVFSSLPAASRAAVLVDLEAAALPLGAVATWTNTGSVSGNFTATGTPAVTRLFGLKCVTFGGVTDFFVGPAAPASVTGVNPSRTIEVWAFNASVGSPGAGDEETMVAWGQRGGPDGSNLAFLYSDNPDYGAVIHWGRDLPWYGAVAAPTLGRWHHLVYTYDGGGLPGQGTARVYADGELLNSRAFGDLDTHAGFPFVLGGQNENNGLPVGINYGLSLARVRIHNVALTDAQIAAAYQAQLTELFPTAYLTGADVPSAENFTFTVNDQSPASLLDPATFSATVAGISAGWRADGAAVDGPVESTLTSPLVIIPNGDPVELRFQHRFSFEYDGSGWDGGAVRVSVNGGAFTDLADVSFTQNGYVRILAGNGPLQGKPAFNGASAGYSDEQLVTSIATIPGLAGGDTLQVQFLGAWDEFNRGTWPNWVIGSATVQAGATTVLAANFALGNSAFAATSTSLRGAGWRYSAGSAAQTIPMTGRKADGVTTLQLPVDWEISRDYLLTFTGKDTTGADLSYAVTVSTPSFAFAPKIQSFTRGPGPALHLGFKAKTFGSYTLQTSTDFSSWNDLQTLIAPNVSGIFQGIAPPSPGAFFYHDPGEPRRFFRIRANP